MSFDVAPTRITLQVEETIRALAPGPDAAGLVALARMYASALAEADDDPITLRDLGPKLHRVLVQLGAGKMLKPDAVAPAVTPTLVTTPVADELAAMRSRRASTA